MVVWFKRLNVHNFSVCSNTILLLTAILCKPDVLLDDSDGVRIVETATDSVRMKHERTHTITSFYGKKWKKRLPFKFPFNFNAASKNYAFQCQFFPNYDNQVRVEIKLVKSPTEKLAVWLSIILSVETAPVSTLTMANGPSLFARNSAFMYYQKPRPPRPSMQQSSVNIAGPIKGNRKQCNASVHVEMYFLERNVYRNSTNTTASRPGHLPSSMPVHNIEYTWTVNDFTRAMSLTSKVSAFTSPLMSSSRFPSDRASPLLFYGTMNRRTIVDDQTGTPYVQIIAGLCYELLCKPTPAKDKAVRRDDEILIEVSTRFTNESAQWQQSVKPPRRSLENVTATSNPARGCVPDISVISFKIDVPKTNFVVQQIFNVRYYGGLFSYRCLSNQTILA